jgi:putative FmdB family regulatory protein
MPLYDRKCDQCGHKKEVLEKVDANKTLVCPECGKKTFKRLMPAPADRTKQWEEECRG